MVFHKWKWSKHERILICTKAYKTSFDLAFNFGLTWNEFRTFPGESGCEKNFYTGAFEASLLLKRLWHNPPSQYGQFQNSKGCKGHEIYRNLRLAVK